MATYLLIPGMWLGGWAWRDVAARLRAAGHDVFPVTLTGLGERVHLGGPEVNLETHIADVVNLIRYEGLRDVVLVGHSYGGVVATVVADRVPERIARLVYVDTGPLPDGVAQADFFPPEVRSVYEQRVAEGGAGWRLPLPPWEELDEGRNLEGLGAAERRRIRERATDMPFGAALQPVRLGNPARARIPKLAIWCTVPSEQVRALVASGNPLFGELAGAEWQFVDLPTGHWPMFSKPAELAGLLDELAGG